MRSYGDGGVDGDDDVVDDGDMLVVLGMIYDGNDGDNVSEMQKVAYMADISVLILLVILHHQH